MKFYFLKNSLINNSGATHISGFSEIQEYDSDRSVYAFGKIDFPEIKEIKYLLLDKDANLEDIICAEMLITSGLLINDKVKKKIENFNLPKHKFYPAYVKDKNDRVFNYYWMQTSYIDRYVDSYVNMIKSDFYIKKDSLELEKEFILINTNEELEYQQSKLEINQAIKISKTVLDKSFLELNLDMFKIGRLDYRWIVTERLKNAFDDTKITGVSFFEVKNLTIETSC